MVYCGCKTCGGKTRWGIEIIALLGATALLIAGLIKCIPSLITLTQCATKENALLDSGICWKTFWQTSSVPFIVTCAGAACLLVAFLTCCCFACAKAPAAGGKKGRAQAQAPQYDTAPQGDQYYHAPAPQGAKGVASV
ncbi:hypothetical protein Rsub_06427 [Raphidocelis subcapitata]|uniref:Uncharacterized protein n=1 Tax=Raphidocelis subcapitata TaxID=307507 RepID=A0A2V0P1E3_9CHLO|nr:hypothetical protein Rsub_06427 [Raphidocelis subcapitata]|eukprot:GBF93389.1 hypothetical protein Rsub_06427 [Raphidocelis subcapitata]